MQTTLSFSCTQLTILSQAITAWLLSKQEMEADSARRVTPFEVLAIIPFSRLQQRLKSMLWRQRLSLCALCPETSLPVTFSLAELLALYYCLPWQESDTSLVGTIYQQLLTYDQYIALP